MRHSETRRLEAPPGSGSLHNGVAGSHYPSRPLREILAAPTIAEQPTIAEHMSKAHPAPSTVNVETIARSDVGWRAALTREQCQVLRQESTERPGASPPNREKRVGVLLCAGWGAELDPSDAKFESGAGWPSFDSPGARAVSELDNPSHFIRRTEVRCARCEGHLGHVFSDGPCDTGVLRYGISGVALKFKPGDG